MTKIPDADELEKINSVEDFLPRGVEVSSDLPVVAGMPNKAQQILCLVACGFSFRSIASVLGCKNETVSYYVTRYDPEHSFRLNPEARRNFLAKLWESRGGEALLQITPEKLKEATARDLAYIAKTAGQALDSLTGEERGHRPDFQRTLKVLAGES